MRKDRDVSYRIGRKFGAGGIVAGDIVGPEGKVGSFSVSATPRNGFGGAILNREELQKTPYTIYGSQDSTIGKIPVPRKRFMPGNSYVQLTDRRRNRLEERLFKLAAEMIADKLSLKGDQ